MTSYPMLINKSHLLGPRDVPNELTEPSIPFHAPSNDPKRLLVLPAAKAAEQLFCHAAEDGFALFGISGYRSYQRQEELYKAAVKKSGGFTDRPYLAVAPPGSSEHQTGLALDVSCFSMHFNLEEEFGMTPEGKWLASHAKIYGFILRYPRGKEPVTGFPYEPWHIRYVGNPLAVYLTMTGLTLEEYHEFSAKKTDNS